MVTPRGFRYILLIALFCFSPFAGALAQEAPATPVPESAPRGTLAEFEIRQLASPHAEVWFMRVQLEPNGRLPFGVQAGQTILYVESGTLTVEAQGVVLEPGNQVVKAIPAQPIMLDPDDSLMLTTTSEATLKNTSPENTTFLALVMFAAEDEGTGSDQGDQPTGFSVSGVSVGAAEFVPGPATVVVERVVIGPGETLSNASQPDDVQGRVPDWSGIDLGMVESGSVEITFEQRSSQNIVWPSLQPDVDVDSRPVILTGTASLTAGESYSGFGSLMTFTNTGDEPVIILRAVVSPHMRP